MKKEILRKIFSLTISFLVFVNLAGCVASDVVIIKTNPVSKDDSASSIQQPTTITLQTNTDDTRKTGVNPTSIPAIATYYPSTTWRTSEPLYQGMDDQMLNKLNAFINDELNGSLNSLLIVRNGYIVKEEYYGGTDKDTLHYLWSITKSFISGLTGIAIDKKFIKSEEQKIVDYFPEYFKKDVDSLKNQITIKHLLTQTHGFKLEGYYDWQNSSDWFQHMLSRPMENTPGEEFNYSNGATHLLSGIITKATKMSTLEFAKKNLFSPLGISSYKWDKDPKGYYGGSHMLSLNTRDMAKYGYLYLNKGEWNGKQVISKEWVEKSVQSQIKGCIHHEYGYLWWITRGRDSVNNRDFYMYNAQGSGGAGESSINIVPDLNLVVVVTANGGDDTKIKRLTTDYIIPSVKSTQ